MNTTYSTPEDCRRADEWLTYVLALTSPVLIVASYIATDMSKSWLGFFRVVLFVIVLNHVYVSFLGGPDADVSNSVVQYVPLMLSSLLSIAMAVMLTAVNVLSLAGETIALFALTYLALSSLHLAANLTASTIVAGIFLILSKSQRVRSAVSILCNAAIYTGVLCVLAAALFAPNETQCPGDRRNYLLVCEPRCPVITTETPTIHSSTVLWIFVCAVLSNVTGVILFLVQWHRRRSAATRSKRETQQMQMDLDALKAATYTRVPTIPRQ